jgi:hypothetical protein
VGRPDGPLGEFLDEYLTTPISLNTALRTEEATTQYENNSQLNTDLRNVKPGNGTVSFADGRFTVETTASGDSAQAIETASLAEYSAGLPMGVGLYVRKDTAPVGIAEWGYGGDAFSDELRWRLASDGSYSFQREKGGLTTTIDRELWDSDSDMQVVTNENDTAVGVVQGLDRLDGSGPSGIDIAPPFSTLFGIDMVLYGGGGFAPWTVGMDRRGRVRKVYPFVFSPAGEEVLDQFNQPVFTRLDNDGTATADSIITTERQATTFGKSTGPERATQHVLQEGVTIDSPTAVTALRRADAGGGTRVDILNTELVVNNRAHVWFLVDPDVTNSPTWQQPARDTAGDRAPTNETVVQAADDIAVDASTGISLDGGIVDGGSGANVTVESTSFASSPFIRDRPVVLMLEPFNDSDITSTDLVFNISEGV